ncbi:hypothetical protein [Paenibacillus sp. Marseille-Q9583]
MIANEITVSELDIPKTLKTITHLFEQYRIRNFVVGQEREDEFISCIVQTVNRLPEEERVLIEERYMKNDYIKDCQVYNCKLDYPISKDTYVKRRNRAILKLILVFCDIGFVRIDELMKNGEGDFLEG